MCELTFVRIENEENNKNTELARIISYTSALINSEDNKDGYGFYSNLSTVSTQITANRINNFGTILRSTNNIILSHVRRASFNGGDKKIGDQYAHPFKSEDFVLAHNGDLTLKSEPKDKETIEQYKEKIDSQIFLDRLQKNYKEFNFDFVSSIEKTISEFYGKFAFLIREVRTENIYIVRGISATLFIAPVVIEEDERKLGYVINTEKDHLLKFLFIADNFYQLMGGRKLLVKESEITKIEENSLHIAESDWIKPITTQLKETFKPANIVPVSPRAYPGFGGSYGNYQGPTGKNNYENVNMAQYRIKLVEDFLSSWNLKIVDLDALFYLFTGESSTILSAGKLEWNRFCDFLAFINTSQGKRGAWNAMMKKLNAEGFYPLRIYKELDVEFPFFLDSRGWRHFNSQVNKAISERKK